MSFGTNKNNGKPYSYFNCTSYRQHGKKYTTCTAHYIRYDVLYDYVLSRIQYWSKQAQISEDKLLQRLLNAGDKERVSANKKRSSELAKAEKRKSEVDRLFIRLYEDWTSGRITEYNFNMMSQKYQVEQQELDEKIQLLRTELETTKQMPRSGLSLSGSMHIRLN